MTTTTVHFHRGATRMQGGRPVPWLRPQAGVEMFTDLAEAVLSASRLADELVRKQNAQGRTVQRVDQGEGDYELSWTEDGVREGYWVQTISCAEEHLMVVVAEVWPIAADEAGIWLLTGADGALQSGPVTAALGVHRTVEQLLAEFGVREDITMLHGTSSRDEVTREVQTHIAVIQCDGLVLDQWPGARPVTVAGAEHVGRPLPHSPAGPPTPRAWDVLLHAIRHVAHQRLTNDDDAAQLQGHWATHLPAWDSTLAVMYRRRSA